MKKTLWIPLSAGLLFVVGCGDSQKPAQETANAPGSKSVATNATMQTSASSRSLSAQLPSEPAEVVQLFLDSMRQGNGSQLSALLTTAAREEIRRKELVIDPLGSPLATFKIGEAAQQGDAMLVSSVWTEPPEQNGAEATELEVVWELRKEAEGWRVCGMAVDPMTGDEVQVVNFESMEQDPTAVATEPQRVASLPNGAAPNAQSFPSNQGFSNSNGQPNLPTQQPAPGQQSSFNLPPANPNNLPQGSGNGLPPGNGFGQR